jgi:ribonuclease HII
MFAPQTIIPGVDDSKQVSPESRERLARRIRGEALGVGIGVVAVEEIEQLNVYHAGLLAMRRAVERLPITPEHLFVDARKIPGVSIPQSSFTKGDRLSFSIAAASIIAKTCRDRLMVDLDLVYPQYGFAQHKGYCTPAHVEALKRYGPSGIHRKFLAFVQELCGEYSGLFYGLKSKVLAATTAAVLRALQEEFGGLRAELGAGERRKLSQLLTRRRAQIQPTAFGLK